MKSDVSRVGHFLKHHLFHNPARIPKNGLQSDQRSSYLLPVSYRKTEVIQSYLRIWGTYDPIESGPSDPKKWGLYRRSVKKCRFSGQNRAPAAAPRPAVQRGQHKNVVFLLSGHDGNKKVGRFWQKNGFWAKKLHFRPEILHFFTLHLWNPHFFGSDGPDSMGS